MSPVRAGEMRHRIRVEERSQDQDQSGQLERHWVLVGERWASVEPLLGKEFFASAQRNARAPTRFRMRYFEKVRPAMRIVWEERVFDVTDVQVPRGVHDEMVVTATEWVGETP